MKKDEIRWEPYRSFRFREEFMKLKEREAFLIHPVFTPKDVAEEIRAEFKKLWDIKQQDLEKEFKEMEDKGLIQKDNEFKRD